MPTTQQNSELKQFLKHYGEALQQSDAALFVGAGLSSPSGFADWRELLREIASDLRLDIDRESDLIAVAQYHVNTEASRARLDRLLIEEFTKDAKPTRNHELMATLPLKSIWTTNYDTLIEDAFRSAGKRPDVKDTPESLAVTLPRRDVVVYKMHGDVRNPAAAVLTKEDYETYDLHRELFSTTLRAHLTEKTFLFLGFSFTDPNIDYILSRIRGLLGQHQRQHYCIMRPPLKGETKSGAERAEADYELRRFDLRMADLKRYSIKVVLVDSYDQVQDVLLSLSRQARSRSVFVSGSIADIPLFDRSRVESLAKQIGDSLVSSGLRLVSGFGLGIGSAVLIGAMESVYRSGEHELEESLSLRPFPQQSSDTVNRGELYRRYREGMLSEVGFAIFLAGSKVDEATGLSIEAPGVFEEFEISVEKDVFPIPIGASGSAAKTLWDRVIANPERFYGPVDVVHPLRTLGDGGSSDTELVNAVLEIIRIIRANLQQPLKSE